MHSTVIVGAGPAGMAAAVVLARAGEHPIIVDEAEQPGGQVWRKPAAPLQPALARILGRAAAAEHEQAHAEFASIAASVDHRPRHLAWNLQGGELFVIEHRRIRPLRYGALLLATGATDRLLPVPGWTLPGVFSLGGAQTLLKDQGALIGRRVVFAGASPLLYLAALQYKAMGATVVAVLDTTALPEKLRATPALAAAAPRVLARGLSYMARLRAGGVAIFHGVTALGIEGQDYAERVRFRCSRGAEHDLAVDAVALGFGLRAETQLLDLAGVPLAFDVDFRQWLPIVDGDGRAAPGLYAAGDGCTIGGAAAAAISGRLAAYAILADRGVAVPATEVAMLRARLARLRAFQRALSRAFAWPAHWLADARDDTVLCRCENVTVGVVRAAVAAPLGPREVNRAKALTRCGMGRCQARFCGLATAELMAHALAAPVATMGRHRSQAPVKPIPLDATLVDEDTP
ncbi:FAD/NAD(P)-binding oxidoreductase [Elioraea sp.]|uniref:NAD(P)/FAD-dependent oxidoreductase n=1 Tax=Elioraea sp. TaxID=2185103 RepID=UPI0025C3E707|nr:FAD/NAD(P)-binding oxidoreductase [Elioraea sp.]